MLKWLVVPYTPCLSQELFPTYIWSVYLCLRGNRLNFYFEKNLLSDLLVRQCLMLLVIFVKPRYILHLLKHNFLSIIRTLIFNSLSQNLIQTLSTSYLFYQFGSQPARFFSLLLATFDVFLLLLKALRKFAAPVRRRNQNMLRCNWNFLVWVIKIRIL